MPLIAQVSAAQTVPASAQNILSALTEKESRRINYYSAQALEALAAFGENSEAEGSLDALRQKVQRLTDAGQRSGLDLSATAAYFESYIAENANAPIPTAFLDGSGQFDVADLLSSVELYYNNVEQKALDFSASDEADIAAISSVARRSTPQAAEVQTAALTEAEAPVVVIELPTIAPNAPANVRAILERVRLRGEDWVITVKQGDSLAQFANALYGDPRGFQKIFEANLAVLITPNAIKVGQELLLPKE